MEYSAITANTATNNNQVSNHQAHNVSLNSTGNEVSKPNFSDLLTEMTKVKPGNTACPNKAMPSQFQEMMNKFEAWAKDNDDGLEKSFKVKINFQMDDNHQAKISQSREPAGYINRNFNDINQSHMNRRPVYQQHYNIDRVIIGNLNMNNGGHMNVNNFNQGSNSSPSSCGRSMQSLEFGIHSKSIETTKAFSPLDILESQKQKDLDNLNKLTSLDEVKSLIDILLKILMGIDNNDGKDSKLKDMIKAKLIELQGENVEINGDLSKFDLFVSNAGDDSADFEASSDVD